ncbi:MAG: 50S ribosomal protein L24 [Ignavibacteria bacterium]
MKMAIKKNDMVKIISGDDKGKEGRVIEVDAKKGRLLVEGVNVHKRHMRKSQAYPDGGRIERELPSAYSNALVIDPERTQPTRIRGASVVAHQYAWRSHLGIFSLKHPNTQP